MKARVAATRPARRGEGIKVEHEYERKGALCYLAAWDARRAKIFDRCAPDEQIAAPFQWKFTRHDLDRLLAKADTPHPIAAAA